MTAKERPILFSAPMVRAILAGKKTQTRRIVKGSTEFRGPYNPAYLEAHKHSKGWAGICPYGAPGDRLWVRESYWCGRSSSQMPCGEYEGYWTGDVQYDEQRAKPGWLKEDQRVWMCRRPSIHMPRRASRITLEVASVRVERLQEISGSDLVAEGYPPDDQGPPRDGCRLTLEGRRQLFAGLWEHLNGPESWDANPWVWVVEFKRINGVNDQ